MSAEFGIGLAILTIGSCFASYWAGRREEAYRWRSWLKRRRERDLRWEEFDDED
jgi:hypothetical protein